ncbi:MAG: hypothetical protein ACOX9E_07340 [Lentisphaeria bacterium]|jgi:hypothetical protein
MNTRKLSQIMSLALFAGGLALSGCIKTKHEIQTQSEIKPIEIKPIHITIDVNVKVDRALDDFFGDIDKNVPK